MADYKDLQSAWMAAEAIMEERFEEWDREFFMPEGERLERMFMDSLAPQVRAYLAERSPEAFESVMKRTKSNYPR